jgi:hypothetical protein
VLSTATAPADFMPNKKKAATTAISQTWNHNVGTKEGMAIPENLGFKTTVTAAKAIVNAIAFVFKNTPFRIIAQFYIKEFQMSDKLMPGKKPLVN